MLKLILLCILSSSVLLHNLNKPRYPVIAIYANPFHEDDPTGNEMDYVHTAYVRWLEASGAVTIVIHHWDTEERITEILNKSNGVLFQGGGTLLNLSNNFTQKADFILKKVLEINDRGIYYPLWGTCQGFELLHMLVSKDNEVLTDTNAYGIITPLLFNTEILKESKMFSFLDDEDIYALKYLNTTSQFHHYGVSEEKFIEHESLSSFFKITTYSEDLDGKITISTVEGKHYPVYAIQSHPEKSNYVRNMQYGVPQTRESVFIGQKLANFFVEEARKNDNTFGNSLYDYDYIDSYSMVPEFRDEVYYYLFSRDDSKIKNRMNFLEDDQ